MKDELWTAIGEIVVTIHPDRAIALSEAIGQIRSVADFDHIRTAFGPNVELDRLLHFRRTWETTPEATPSEVAAAFRTATEVARLLEDRSGTVELVWTGPNTGLIPIRQTEQVLLELIDSANEDLFLVSYVFFRALSIVKGLNAAVQRGVGVSILLESSSTVQGDSVGKLAEGVPGATIYVWDSSAKIHGEETVSASVHAKCAVADRKLAFVTSANLTSAALERNMELGLLIRGGTVPGRLRSHLGALAVTKIITKR